jgi:DoxX-like family
MHSDKDPALFSRSQLWAARIISALVVLFLLFDATIHLTKPAPVVDAFARLGYPLKASIGIGIVEVVCLVAYIVPRTAPLGAILLTGLLGGAIATHVRAGSPIFETYLFPILFGLLMWGGIWLRDDRLRKLVPLRIAD